MTYTKKQFGSELKTKILIGSNCDEISKWAFKIYIDHGLEFECNLDCFVLKLMAMEEGPEFLLSEEKLKLLVDELMGAVRN